MNENAGFMSPFIDFISSMWNWIEAHWIIGIGVLFTFFGLLFTLSEIRVYVKHKSTPDLLIFWIMSLITGITTLIFNDFVLGILLGLSLYMIIETIRIWDTPVWGKLMASSTAAYLVILGGKIGQVAYDRINKPDLPNDQIFSAAFNVSFYVFMATAFFFFGRKFIIVSRFSSPQMLYLFLFGVLYIFIAKSFPTDLDGNYHSYNYLNIQGAWKARVIFADFGTYEAMILLMIFMYLISGWLLDLLFGVKPVNDEKIIQKVKNVAEKIGIKDNIKVGFMKAPILNAFAYGSFFDKRIAFMASDLEEFDDADINGIVSHELAHTAKNHVIILLLISILELGIKKALGFPASTLDYTFLPNNAIENIKFVGYYFFSYGLVIVLLILVRVLEGHADKVTKEIGYGDELCRALYKLEGFYTGVASDFGISVNLLTDKQYTKYERQRFTAEAARNLYGEILFPSRGAAFSNILQSHPRTSYRIIALTSEKMNPLKFAFLPYRLLGFGLRKKAIKQVNQFDKKVMKILDKSYLDLHGEDALKIVKSNNPWKESYENFIGKQVIIHDPFNKKAIHGTFVSLIETTSVSSPYFGKIDDTEFDLMKSTIKLYYPGENYFLKDGSIFRLERFEIDEDQSPQLIGKINNMEKTIKLSNLGMLSTAISDLKGKEVLFFNKGLTKLERLNDIEITSSFKSSNFTIGEKQFTGKDLIIGFNPLGFEIRKTHLDKQFALLQFLVGKRIYLYTKQNFDVSLSGTVASVDENEFSIRDHDGDHTFELDDLKYIYFNLPTIEIITKEHVSLFTKIGIWWSNRKKFVYIN
ncbi:MAG: M48 family metalloprotease [Candidatus Heimdallarchaeota archaeon]|nr:M48 family metalloprotease [Candidatus Heimdallarchaeota archaeon]